MSPAQAWMYTQAPDIEKKWPVMVEQGYGGEDGITRLFSINGGHRCSLN